MFLTWLLATWDIIVTSAPWLLVGFFVAGILHVLLPTSFIERFLKKPGAKSVLLASGAGLPLPLCSCSVIPVATSLRKKGASKGATASFFVSTPEIGVDSFLLTYALLGPIIATGRVIAAFFSAFAIGIAIDFFDKKPSPRTNVQTTQDCCHKEKKRKVQLLLRESFQYGFGTLVEDLSKTLVIGFFLAGAVIALLPEDLFQSFGLSPFTMLPVALLISLPTYVCAVASTPLAAALVAKGLSAGAAIVFLLAGPATNIATMLVIKRELGFRALCIYLAGLFSVTLGIAFFVDMTFEPTSLNHIVPHIHEHPPVFGVPFLLGLCLTTLLGSGLMKEIKRAKSSGK